MGSSVLMIRESGTTTETAGKSDVKFVPFPILTIITPELVEEHIIVPAKSIALSGTEVEHLYKFLKTYYDKP